MSSIESGASVSGGRKTVGCLHSACSVASLWEDEREVQLMQCSQNEVVGETQHPTYQIMHLTVLSRGVCKAIMLVSCCYRASAHPDKYLTDADIAAATAMAPDLL